MPTPEQLLNQIDRLRSTLLKSGLQQSNQPLFQVINSLIGVLKSALSSIVVQISGGGGTGLTDQHYLTYQNDLAVLPNSKELVAGDNVTFNDAVPGQRIVNVGLDQTFLTSTDESASLPNSRQLLPGNFIAFDDSVANERTVNGSSWSLLTNGDVDNPELIFAGGDVIMVHTP